MISLNILSFTVDFLRAGLANTHFHLHVFFLYAYQLFPVIPLEAFL